MRGYIFDLDGVIVDTAKYHYLGWKRLADELGLHFSEQDNELLKGVSRIRSFEIILELNGREMPQSEIEKYCTVKNEYYVEYIRQITPDELLPGVRDFIREIRKQGIGTALGSASKNARTILNKLEIEDLFDAVVDGTMVSRAKPDPEVFLKGAEMLGAAPADCIVFEDAVAGIVAAHNGGMKAVGVGNSEVRECCDLFIPSFGGVTAAVIEKKLGL